MEPFFIIFVFIAVIALTAILFGGWVIVTVIRLLAGGAAALFGPKTPHALASPPGWTCRRLDCRCNNPSHARFCRRCGNPVAARQNVMARRIAAML